MKRFVILSLFVANCLFAGENSSDYITYDEFLKIKSYFNEDGCAGIEKFLESSKDLKISDEEEVINMVYGDLYLLSRSTAFTTIGGGKEADGTYKNSWENKFPKDKKVSIITFNLPSNITNKCKNHNNRFNIIYEKSEGKLTRNIIDNDDLDDDSHADSECLLRQFPIFKSKPRFGIVKSLNNKIGVKVNIYPDSKQRDKINTGQKVRILGSIKNLSYVYYNKKTKGACDPLHMVDGCNSGWVDTSLIDEIQSVQPKILSFDDYKKSIQSFLPPKNEYESKIVRNLPYAIRGYIFQDKKVQEFYESLNWYVADKNYRPDLLMLSESEQQWIDQWK